MPLLPPLITCTPNAQPLYASVTGGGGGGQVLSQTGNTVALSGGGGSVDIASTTLVADTAQKTTAMTYNGGLLATEFSGDLFVGRTEVGKPLEPQPLTVNGTLDVIIDPTGFVRLTNLGSVFPAGQSVLYIDPILGTVGQGGAPASTWVGTATSDLDMAGYNINNASAVGIKSDTGLLEFKNGAGVSKGSLAYNEADGDIHLFAEDTLDLTANTAIDITATNGDLTLATTNTNIYVNSAGGLAMTGATAVSITAPTINLNGNITSPIALAGTSPSILYDAGTVSYAFTDLAPLFANFWLITITSTSGFFNGQTVTLSGCSDPAKDGSVTIGNVASPTQLWLTGIFTPYLGTPVSGNINAFTSHTLIGGQSDAWSIANGTIVTGGGTMTIKAQDSSATPSATLSQAGSLSLADSTAGKGELQLFNNNNSPMLRLGEDPNYLNSQQAVVENLIVGRSLTVRSQTNDGYCRMGMDASNKTVNVGVNNGFTSVSAIADLPNNTFSIYNTGGITAEFSDTVTITAQNSVNINVVDDVNMISSGGGTLTANFETVSIGASTTCSIGGQGTTISGGDEYLTMGAETVTVTSASNIDMTTGQFVNITATANDINLTANAGSIVANAGGGAITTNSGSVSMTTTSGGIELHANGANLVLASGADAVSISSGIGDNVSITAGGGGLILTTDGDLILTGAGIQDTAFGAVSGQYLRIKLNGTYYKIQLLDDV